MDAPWRVELLGGLRAVQAERRIAHFEARVGSLLAYLACHHQHPQPREVLIELLWPEIDPTLGRNNLRYTLHCLRRLLEPPGTLPGAVLVATRSTIHLHPSAFTTDIQQFQSSLQAATGSDDPARRAGHLAAAVDLYQGELLPGWVEPWVLTERQQLAERYLGTLQQLVGAREQAGDLKGALEAARLAVAADPLREEAHYDLMRLYAAAGQPSATLRQYEELERLLREELGEAPSAATRALAEELHQSARTVVVARAAGAWGSSLSTGSSAGPRGETTDSLPAGAAAPPSPPPPNHGPIPLSPDRPRLPVQFTRFFGREEEITHLADTLRIPETRLVTLTGPGGSGKTRLAIAVAGRLQEEFEGTVWFVPLGQIGEPRRIADAVRDALHLPPGGEPWEQVVAALNRQPTLLVLDNFEQLVEEGASLVRQLLERAPSLTCLMTSRQRLEVEGEQEFVVLPLPVPGLRAQGSGLRAQSSDKDRSDREPCTLSPEAELLLQYPSVALFVDRARGARPGFELTAENAGAVAALCDRLEGLPLAIELAAARAAVLTPQQMLARLEKRFELLVSGRRDVSARHRTLWAALEWSYQLLSPELRRFLCHLSVFRGGFFLEAAEAICSEAELPGPAYRWGGDLLQISPPRVENPAALEHLEQLQQCSLVIADETPAGMRYRLLETVREFSAAQLTSEEQAALARRHLHYYMPLAHETRHRAAAQQRSAAMKRRLHEIDTEYENLRAGLEWALQHEPDVALWLAAALGSSWFVRASWTEALEFLPRAALFQSDLTMEMRAKALVYAGDIACEVGNYQQARAWLEEARALGHRMGTPETLEIARHYEGRSAPDPDVDRMRVMGANEYIGSALFVLGKVAVRQGDYAQARAFYQESCELRTGLWSEEIPGPSLAGLGEVALAQGEYETARRYFEQSERLHREAGQQRLMAMRLRSLGHLDYYEGSYEQAEARYRESLTIFQEWGDRVSVARTYGSLGDVTLAQGKLEVAGECYRESMMGLRQVAHRRGVAAVLEGSARLAQLDGHLERAARLFGAARALREALGSPLPPHQQPELEARLGALRGALGEAAFTAEWERGRSLSWEQAAAITLEDH